MKEHLIQTLLILTFFIIQGCNKEDNIVVTDTTEFEEYITDEMDIQKIPAMSILILTKIKFYWKET